MKKAAHAEPPVDELQKNSCKVPGRFWLGTILPIVFLRSLSYPYGLATKTLHHCWATDISYQVSCFRTVGRPSTHTPLTRDLHACVRSVGKPRRSNPRTNRANTTSGVRQTNPKAGRSLQMQNILHILSKASLLPPGTTYLPPPGGPSRHPIAPLRYRSRSSLGRILLVFEAKRSRRHAA